MTTEQDLEQLARRYAAQGYETIVRPGPQDLPPFARGFVLDLLARRGDGGVLVVAKRDRAAVASDAELPKYAEATAAQPNWRFDLQVLHGDGPMGRRPGDVREPTIDDIHRALAEAEQVSRMGFIRAAVVTAWGAMEAAMRMRLRSMGETAGWGSMPRELINGLYSSGVLSPMKFERLERVHQWRNEIVHGFSSQEPTPDTIEFMSTVAKRLVDESRLAKQSA
jgi:hypothetical protein